MAFVEHNIIFSISIGNASLNLGPAHLHAYNLDDEKIFKQINDRINSDLRLRTSYSIIICFKNIS